MNIAKYQNNTVVGPAPTPPSADCVVNMMRSHVADDRLPWNAYQQVIFR